MSDIPIIGINLTGEAALSKPHHRYSTRPTRSVPGPMPERDGNAGPTPGCNSG